MAPSKVRREGDIRIVEVSGSLDMSNNEETRSVFREILADSPSAILIDLGGLQYLKSSGFQALFELLESSREKGIHVGLVGPPKGIDSVISVFRLDEMMPVYSSLTEALAKVRESKP